MSRVALFAVALLSLLLCACGSRGRQNDEVVGGQFEAVLEDTGGSNVTPGPWAANDIFGGPGTLGGHTSTFVMALFVDYEDVGAPEAGRGADFFLDGEPAAGDRYDLLATSEDYPPQGTATFRWSDRVDAEGDQAEGASIYEAVAGELVITEVGTRLAFTLRDVELAPAPPERVADDVVNLAEGTLALQADGFVELADGE